MIDRLIDKRARNLASQFPVLVITGPRQSGKTTVAKHLFPNKPYVNLERPDTLDRFKRDPAGSLKPLLESGAVLDEAQRFPELGSWLQGIVDENPQAGQWILTGSNQPLLRESVSQSLAGRAAYLTLPPFCSLELAGQRTFDSASTDEVLLKGWYPPLYDRRFKAADWYEQYVATYIERDLSLVMKIKDLSLFRRFLALCAGRSGQILNLSDLARDAGISHTTAREWISALEYGFLVFLLKPYHTNFGKRISKSQKLYFWDCGLAARLVGITEPGQLAVHPLRGPLFETMVVGDIIKEAVSSSPSPEFYFWNAPGGGEVDLIAESGSSLQGIEVKSAATFRPEYAQGLIRWSEVAGIAADRMQIVYDGSDSFEYKGLKIRPWRRSGRA